MKQGRAQHSGSGGTKMAPITRPVSPSAVSEIGIKKGNHVSERGHTIPHTSKSLYEGRGVTAPHEGTTIHNKGSQGRHK